MKIGPGDEAKIEHHLARYGRRKAINSLAWSHVLRGIKPADRAPLYELCRDVIKRHAEAEDLTTEQVKALDVAVLLRGVRGNGSG